VMLAIILFKVMVLRRFSFLPNDRIKDETWMFHFK
jgi:hypothetical protein